MLRVQAEQHERRVHMNARTRLRDLTGLGYRLGLASREGAADVFIEGDT